MKTFDKRIETKILKRAATLKFSPILVLAIAIYVACGVLPKAARALAELP